jgi:hypothetical protein
MIIFRASVFGTLEAVFSTAVGTLGGFCVIRKRGITVLLRAMNE